MHLLNGTESSNQNTDKKEQKQVIKALLMLVVVSFLNTIFSAFCSKFCFFYFYKKKGSVLYFDMLHVRMIQKMV